MDACQKGMDIVGKLFEGGENFAGDLIDVGRHDQSAGKACGGISARSRLLPDRAYGACGIAPREL